MGKHIVLSDKEVSLVWDALSLYRNQLKGLLTSRELDLIDEMRQLLEEEDHREL